MTGIDWRFAPVLAHVGHNRIGAGDVRCKCALCRCDLTIARKWYPHIGIQPLCEKCAVAKAPELLDLSEHLDGAPCNALVVIPSPGPGTPATCPVKKVRFSQAEYVLANRARMPISMKAGMELAPELTAALCAYLHLDPGQDLDEAEAQRQAEIDRAAGALV